MNDSPNGEDELRKSLVTDTQDSSAHTYGSFETEEDAAKEFDRRVSLVVPSLFSNVYREVNGQYLQPRLHTKERWPKIDRILMPAEKLIAAGWSHGPIGIEIEASRRKIAYPIEQCMDYTRAVWTIKNGYHIHLEWFFIWPWTHSYGAPASLARQNRIGGVYFNANCLLVFMDDQTCAIRIDKDGGCSAHELRAGKKTGHR